MKPFSIEPRIKEYAKRYEFLSFAKNLFHKYGKNYCILLQKQDYNPSQST